MALGALAALLCAAALLAAGERGGAVAGAGQSRPAQQTAALTLAKLADTGSDNPSIVYNGDVLTYTVVVTNSGNMLLSSVAIYNALPGNTFEAVACVPECHRQIEVRILPEPLGGQVVVSRTREVTWTIGSLGPGETRRVAYYGRVIGRTDGSTISGPANATSDQTTAVASNDLVLSVRVRVGDIGRSTVSSAPTWLSDDFGGTISQDWGDYDQDGLMDLALASSVGAYVYRNTGSGLQQVFWSKETQSYGARWADIDGDSAPELVVVGDSADRTPVSQGINTVYKYDGIHFVAQASFTSTSQLVRIAAADVDGNGTVDLIGSTNSINAACPVVLFRNTDGAVRGPGECLSTNATAALGVGDFNNDDRPDLAVGVFPNEMRILINDGAGHFPLTNSIQFDTSIFFLPYDFSWGDFDGDGYLDLAAAFPLMMQTRIYRNDHGRSLARVATIDSRVFLTPLAVDWLDYNGDGRLELAVAEASPKLYRWNGQRFDPVGGVEGTVLSGQLWSTRAAQTRPNREADLSITDRDNPSMLFSAASPRLATSLATVGTMGMNDVAWGDLNSDLYLDLVFGAARSLNTELWTNQYGAFVTRRTLNTNLGPQRVSLGDLRNTGKLDLVVSDQTHVSIFQAPDYATAAVITLPTPGPYVIALGDATDDGWLDILVGSAGGPTYLYANRAGSFTSQPAYTTPETCATRSVAWADVDGDRYLDFAVGCYGGFTRVYRNLRSGLFEACWAAMAPDQTTAVAWSDFNGDGWPDLAIGNSRMPTVVYENQNGRLASVPVWRSPTVSDTQDIAWGDWNNDGYPDLALANSGAPNQVFANLGSQPGQPRLVWVWTSDNLGSTTGVAWGDVDNDGDLDLAVSGEGQSDNGFYLNSTNNPGHLGPDYLSAIPLPNVAPYVWVKRPGRTDGAYFFSSSELLSGPAMPTVTVAYKVYDPSGSRAQAGSNRPGQTITRTIFEYSLDGGSTWKAATARSSSPAPVTRTQRLGVDGLFVWDAARDKAISDNARFRVSIVDVPKGAPVQRVASSAVSPPFRVRALTCYWPDGPSIIYSPTAPLPGQKIYFTGRIQAGSGQITYTWQFAGTAGEALGVKQVHTYPVTGRYLVTLTVTGEACPITRPVQAAGFVQVGYARWFYLPLVMRSAMPAAEIPAPVGAEAPAEGEAIQPVSPDLAPPASLAGEALDTGGVRLRWQVLPEAGAPAGFRVYRRPAGGGFVLLAELPPGATDYVDPLPACGGEYEIVAYDGLGESLPGASTYASLPCTR